MSTCLSVAGNSPLDVKDLRDGQFQISKYSRRGVLLQQLLVSFSSNKIRIFSQFHISSRFRVGGSWPVAMCVSESHLLIQTCSSQDICCCTSMPWVKISCHCVWMAYPAVTALLLLLPPKKLVFGNYQRSYN